MPRRRAPHRLAVCLLAAVTVLAGCGGSDESVSDPPADPPTPNQDLRVAVGDDPFLRDGRDPDVGLRPAGPNPGIFETLTRLTGAFGVTPGLARGWEAPSNAHWRFSLRPNVTFHNGTRMDAPAVVAALETIAARQNRPRGLDPGTAKATGDLSIEITLTTDNARLAEQLASPAMGIQAPGTQAGAGEEPATTPTGTGPFRFDTYKARAELKVKVNDAYWGAKPQLRTITFRFGPEGDAGRLLATRQVDVVGLVPFELLPKVSGRTDRVVASQPARAQFVLLNVGGIDEWATLRDDKLRKAVALAVDNRVVAETAWPEDGEESDTLIPELILGDAGERVKAPSRNVQESNRLLDEAEWTRAGDGIRVKDGRTLNLSLVLARPLEQRRAADVLEDQLSEVGVGLQVVDPNPESPFTRVNNATFDLYMASQAQDDGNPCALCRFFTIRPGGQLAFASAAGGGQKADDLYERAFVSPSTDTVRRLAADIVNVVVAERFTAIPLASLRNEWLVSPRVRGFEAAALYGDQRWDSVWLTV